MREQNRGRTYENKLAKEHGYRKVPLSGAGVFKEDLVGEFEIIQAKSTGAESFSLKKIDMHKVITQGARTGKVGVMFIEMGSDEYVVMSKKDYKTYVQFDPKNVFSDCLKEIPRTLCEECNDSPGNAAV